MKKYLLDFYFYSQLELFVFLSLNFVLNDFRIFLGWEVMSLYSASVVMIVLFGWMSLSFMSFILLISSLVIYYSKEYMVGDVNINNFLY